MAMPATPEPKHRPFLPCARRAALATAAVAVALVAAATAVAAPGDVVWKEFSQRTSGGEDAWAALVVSPTGEACVAGVTAAAPGAPSDVAVRKYGPGGATLWRRVWTWPARSHDVATAIARDRRGGIVVAGSSGSRWLLLKYSRRGYLQWVRRGRASFARASFAAVAVDGSGNVFAAGVATPAGRGSRLLLRKYSTGRFRWQRTLSSSTGNAAAAAVVLGGGDVYVVGRSATGPGTSAATTVKYSAAGARRWVRRYAASGSEAVLATAAGYAAGPVVAGWGAAEGGSPDGFVARYAANGRLAWVAGHDDPEVAGDRFTALSADAGGVCVTGSRGAGDQEQMITLRFDAVGGLAWERVTSGATQGLAVCPVPGGFCSAGGTAAATAGVTSATGAPVWEETLTPAGYADFRPVVLRSAGGEYLYAAGSAGTAGGGGAAMLIRYRP
jgi:hypothetical protein